MRLPGRRSQNSAGVLLLDGAVVLILVAVDVGQRSAEGMQHRLRSTRIPFLASGTGKNVRMCLALDQQQNLHVTTDNSKVNSVQQFSINLALHRYGKLTCHLGHTVLLLPATRQR